MIGRIPWRWSEMAETCREMKMQ